MKKQSISFVVPGVNVRPGGGLRIILEYANRLACKGFDVALVHDGRYTLNEARLPRFLKRIIICLFFKRGISWFNLEDSIKRKLVFSLDNDSVPDGDIVVATAAVTAGPVADLSASKGLKLYLVQDWETWNLPENELEKTFTSGMKNIAISHWLAERIRKLKVPCECIPNPIDTHVFYASEQYKREITKIAVMYNTKPHKGFKVAWEAILMAKQRLPKLKVEMFGIEAKPEWLPDWVRYTHCASDDKLREIYNTCSVYVCASNNEGFGLTCVEAMACGSALVVTDFLGSREYAINERNALVSPVGDSNRLAQSICELLANDGLRKQITSNAIEDALARDWDSAVERFIEVIEK